MARLLVHWLLNTLALLVTAYLLPGIVVTGLAAALIAAIIIGLINATLGALLKVLTFPLIVVTLGVFWFVINALMLMLASAIVPGFEVRGFFTAFLGAIVMAIVNMLLRWLVMAPEPRRG
jgi:putative membrane protein